MAAPDPVRLHDADALRPAVQPVQVVEQPVGVGGDLEEPLVEVFLGGLGAAPPANAVDDLFVGQHSVVLRAPVDRSQLLVSKTTLQELEEEPLRPPVVIRVAGGHLAVPGIHHAHQIELVLGDPNVLLGGYPGRDTALDGGVLRGQTKRVPAEGIEHVVAAHQLVAGEGVADHVVAEMAHVQRPRRVGEHDQVVELGLGRVLADLEQPGSLPGRPPFGFDCLRIVDGGSGFGHLGEVWWSRRDSNS